MSRRDDLLRERIRRIETIPDRLINSVNALQSELFTELVEILSQLSGRGELSAETLELVDQLMEQYYQRLRNGKYGGYVNWFAQEIDAQKNIADEIFGLDFTQIASERSVAIMATAKKQSVQALIGGDFKTNFINVIRDQALREISGGSTFEQMISSLSSLFTNTERKDGRILSWVKQQASDRFAIADRAYNQVRAGDLGLQFFRYAGGLIKDSREFCVERAEKIYHIEEAKGWAALQWQGKMVPQTTEETILQLLGGFRCNHVAAYISDVLVPPDVMQRAKANGWYVD